MAFMLKVFIFRLRQESARVEVERSARRCLQSTDPTVIRTANYYISHTRRRLRSMLRDIVLGDCVATSSYLPRGREDLRA